MTGDDPRPAYEKPWLSFREQLALLAQRGLTDAPAFRQYLENIGYYRLSGYWYTFRAIDPAAGGGGDQFFADALMSHVAELYEFDSRLRAAVWSAVGRVELALRVQVGYHLGKIDRFVHLHPELLDQSRVPSDYEKFNAEISKLQARSREDFVAHFRSRYDGRLPIWVVTEIMQLGQLVKLFELAPYDSRRAIAAELGVRADEYQSWLKALNIVRNVVAHHGRLWNRAIVIQPKMPRGAANPAPGWEDEELWRP